MRHGVLSLLLIATALLQNLPAASAVPVTNNNTPGGIMANNISTNIKLWLRADALSQGDGTEVTSWTDSAPHGYNATGTTGNVPFYDTGTPGVLNGLPTLQFNDHPALPGPIPASNSVLRNSTLLTAGAGHFTGNENATSFTAYRNSTYPANDHLGIETTGSGVSSVDLYQGVSSYNNDFRSNRIGGAAFGYPSTGSHIKEVVSRDSDDSWRLFADGSLKSNLAGAPTQSWGLNTVYSIGENSTHTNSSFGGEIAETIIYNTALNDAQRKVVENYLSSKYEIAIDISGGSPGQDLYHGDLNGNGDYDFDVIGIGRLNASNQQSNSGAHGFGIESTALGDGNWLFAGRANISQGIVPMESNGNLVGQRWQRAYYLEKTGVLDATLAFDFEDAGLTAPLSSDFRLLYSADKDFSDGWQFVGQTNTISSGTVFFNLLNANLANGYYALALNVSELPEPGSLSLLGIGLLVLLRRSRRCAA